MAPPQSSERTCAHCASPLRPDAVPRTTYCSDRCRQQAAYIRRRSDPELVERDRAKSRDHGRRLRSTPEGRAACAAAVHRHMDKIRRDPAAWARHRQRRNDSKRRPRRARLAARTCERCAAPISAEVHARAHYCTLHCRLAAKSDRRYARRRTAAAARPQGKCAQCGKSFAPRAPPHYHRSYCSASCRRIARLARARRAYHSSASDSSPPAARPPGRCARCGASIELKPRGRPRRYCSGTCRSPTYTSAASASPPSDPPLA